MAQGRGIRETLAQVFGSSQSVSDHGARPWHLSINRTISSPQNLSVTIASQFKLLKETLP